MYLLHVKGIFWTRSIGTCDFCYHGNVPSLRSLFDLHQPESWDHPRVRMRPAPARTCPCCRPWRTGCCPGESCSGSTLVVAQKRWHPGYITKLILNSILIIKFKDRLSIPPYIFDFDLVLQAHFRRPNLRESYLGVDGSLVFDHLPQHRVDHAALAATDLPDYRHQTTFLHRQIDAEINGSSN